MATCLKGVTRAVEFGCLASDFCKELLGGAGEVLAVRADPGDGSCLRGSEVERPSGEARDVQLVQAVGWQPEEA